MTPLQIVYKTTNPIEQLNPYVRALPSHKCTTACSSSVLTLPLKSIGPPLTLYSYHSFDLSALLLNGSLTQTSMTLNLAKKSSKECRAFSIIHLARQVYSPV